MLNKDNKNTDTEEFKISANKLIQFVDLLYEIDI